MERGTMIDKIDVLNRQEFVRKLLWVVRQLGDSGNGCTFAIDGQWGSGKSYILDILEREISLFQHPEAAGDRYIVFRYDCWKYDYYDEPAIAIIAAIRDACEKEKRLLTTVENTQIRAVFETAKGLGKELLCNVVETRLGWSPTAMLERYEANKEGMTEEAEKSQNYDTFFEFKDVLNKTRKQLAEMAEEKPIIIIVDELDRCIPDYAIKVLERLHHLFEDQPNITVVLAYDGLKLQHVIKNIYGIEGQDVRHFMRKFVSFSMNLDNGQIADSFWSLHSQYLELFDIDSSLEEDIVPLREFTFHLFNGMDARTQEKIFSRMMLLHKLAFDKMRHPSILYFELIYQVLWEKYSNKPLDSWIFDLNNHVDNPEMELITALGQELYMYIRDQEFKIHKEVITLRSRHYYTIKEDPISLAFWYIAHFREKTSEELCRHYYLRNSEKYYEIVEAAKRFNVLSNTIQ